MLLLEKWGRLDFTYSLLSKPFFKWTLIYNWQLKTVDESLLFELFPKVEGREKYLDKETLIKELLREFEV